jgi:hypothetical protein
MKCSILLYSFIPFLPYVSYNTESIQQQPFGGADQIGLNWVVIDFRMLFELLGL